MTISLFRSTKEPDIFGFTDDPTGRKLPPELGPWQSAGAGTAAALYAGTSLDGLSLSNPIMKAVGEDGFYLARSGPVAMPASLHVFQSTKTPEMFGFTVVADGTNLPIENGPWEPAGDAIPLGITMASTSPAIVQQIECNGYALVKGHSASQPHLRRGDSEP